MPKRRYKKISSKKNAKPKPINIPKLSIKARGLQFVKSLWGIVTIIITLSSLYAIFFPTPLNKLFKTKHDNFIDDTFISGIASPYYPYQRFKYSVGFASASLSIPSSGILKPIQLNSGVEDESQSIKGEFSLNLKIQYRRFLISILIKDFKTGEIIAEIQDNKWIIKKTGISDFNSDNLLEIIDKYGYVAFSMWIDEKRILQIRGYCVGNNYTYFLNEHNIRDDGEMMDSVSKNDPNYEKKCDSLASLLKSRFAKKL